MRTALVLALAAALLGAAGEARAVVRLDRPGTAALGGGGSYALVTGEGRYGLDFDNGAGYHFFLKYTVAPRWALGFRFENQSFGWVDGVRREDDELAGFTYDRMTMTTFEAQVTYYTSRNRDASPYVAAGIGYYRPELREATSVGNSEVPTADGGTVFPGGNVMATLGAGAEVFLREKWALDLSARSMLLYGSGYADNELNADGFDEVARRQAIDTPNASFAFQLSIGILYYVTK